MHKDFVLPQENCQYKNGNLWSQAITGWTDGGPHKTPPGHCELRPLTVDEILTQLVADWFLLVNL